MTMWGDEAGQKWNDGYVVETPYTESIFADLNPAMFSMAAVLMGQPPINPSKPSTWIDLGCGNGLTACMVAAANPNVQVWGCDFNSRHVERAREFASKVGLDNCRFDEASFADVAANDHVGPSEADVIFANGVFSWISQQHQRDFTEVVDRRLRAGGLAYVHSITATGWSAMEPLAEAIRLKVDADGRRVDLAFSDATAMIQRLADSGAAYFPVGPRETATMNSWSRDDPRYAVHEYCTANFGPLMFDQLAAAMDTARCSYLGSLEAADHLSPQVSSGPAGRSDDVVTRQLIRDLSDGRMARKDLFRRGLTMATVVESDDWVRQLCFVGLGKSLDKAPVVDVVNGALTLDAAFYRPIADALGEGPLDVDAVRELCPGLSAPDAVAAMAVLVQGGYAAPERPGWRDTDSGQRCRRMNQVLIAENRLSASHEYLVTPATGGAVQSEYVEMLCLGAMWDGAAANVHAISDEVEQLMAKSHRLIREDYRLVTDRSEARLIIEQRVERALSRARGVFEQLGIC